MNDSIGGHPTRCHEKLSKRTGIRQSIVATGDGSLVTIRSGSRSFQELLKTVISIESVSEGERLEALAKADTS